MNHKHDWREIEPHGDLSHWRRCSCGKWKNTMPHLQLPIPPFLSGDGEVVGSNEYRDLRIKEVEE